MRRRARHYLSSLRGRGVLLVSLVTVIAVVVSSAVGLWRGRALLEEQTLRHLGNVADVAALDLDERLQTRFEVIMELPGRVRGPVSGLAQRATDVLVANSALRNLFSSLIFTDAQGQVVAAYPDPVFLARDLSEHAWFQDTARALTGRINGPFLGAVYRRPLVNITAPLFDHNNRFIGVVAGTLELDERSFLGRLGSIPVGESGYLVVANREGMVIAHGEEGQIMKRVPDQHALIQSMLRGEEGAGETWRADGLPVLVAYRQINQADWFVAAVLPHREALRPVNRFMVSALLASLAALVVLLLICGRVFGRLFRPLEVLEDALEDRLAKGSNEPIALQGSAEIRAIAQTFNRVFTERLRTLAELDAERQQQERRLSWEATHDALTGLVNRRAFMAQLVHWLQQVQHEDKQAVLAMVDLDHFKPVNDQGGHLLGDELLRELARVMREHVRQTDVVARLGGDEFAIILPGCSLARAQTVLEAVRAAVEALQLSHDGKTFGVTSSIGVTPLRMGDASPRETIARADEACYEAKGQGRNRVVVHPGPAV